MVETGEKIFFHLHRFEFIYRNAKKIKKFEEHMLNFLNGCYHCQFEKKDEKGYYFMVLGDGKGKLKGLIKSEYKPGETMQIPLSKVPDLKLEKDFAHILTLNLHDKKYLCQFLGNNDEGYFFKVLEYA